METSRQRLEVEEAARNEDARAAAELAESRRRLMTRFDPGSEDAKGEDPFAEGHRSSASGVNLTASSNRSGINECINSDSKGGGGFTLAGLENGAAFDRFMDHLEDAERSWGDSKTSEPAVLSERKEEEGSSSELGWILNYLESEHSKEPLLEDLSEKPELPAPPAKEVQPTPPPAPGKGTGKSEVKGTGKGVKGLSTGRDGGKCGKGVPGGKGGKGGYANDDHNSDNDESSSEEEDEAWHKKRQRAKEATATVAGGGGGNGSEALKESALSGVWGAGGGLRRSRKPLTREETLELEWQRLKASREEDEDEGGSGHISSSEDEEIAIGDAKDKMKNKVELETDNIFDRVRAAGAEAAAAAAADIEVDDNDDDVDDIAGGFYAKLATFSKMALNELAVPDEESDSDDENDDANDEEKKEIEEGREEGSATVNEGSLRSGEVVNDEENATRENTKEAKEPSKEKSATASAEKKASSSRRTAISTRSDVPDAVSKEQLGADARSAVEHEPALNMPVPSEALRRPLMSLPPQEWAMTYPCVSDEHATQTLTNSSSKVHVLCVPCHENEVIASLLEWALLTVPAKQPWQLLGLNTTVAVLERSTALASEAANEAHLATASLPLSPPPHDAIGASLVCLVALSGGTLHELEALVSSTTPQSLCKALTCIVVAAPASDATPPSSSSAHQDEPAMPKHPLELFTRLPAFHSWPSHSNTRPSSVAKLDHQSHINDVILEPENEVETALCVVKSYMLGPGADSKVLRELLGSLLCRLSGCYLAGCRVLHAHGDPALRPKNASSCVTFGTLEYLKHLEAASSSSLSGNNLILVLALRGARAASAVAGVLGPADPSLARRTDPTSLRAQHGRDRERNLVVLPSGPAASKELSFWLGGRVFDASTVTTNPALASHLPRLRPAPFLALRVPSRVLVALADHHAARLGSLLVLTSQHGLAPNALFTVAESAITSAAASTAAANGGAVDLLHELNEWLNGRPRAIILSLQAECAEVATRAVLSGEGFGDCFCAPDLQGTAAQVLQPVAPPTSVGSEVSSSDFAAVASVASDVSLPQTLVLCVPLTQGQHGGQVGQFLTSLLASPPSLPPSESAAASRDTTTASSTSSGTSSLVDALPFELLGLTVNALCSEASARRVASACLATVDESTVTSFTGAPLLVVCVRCPEGRRKLKLLLGNLVASHAQAGSLKPSPVLQVLCSKAPRAALSLMATFFPVDCASNSFSADYQYPLTPWRGLECLPPRRIESPCLAFFPPPELPNISTVSVLSPSLSWLHLPSSSSNDSAPPSSSISPPSSPRNSHQRTPAVLVRVLRRLLVEGLSVKSLALRRMQPSDWSLVPELHAAANGPPLGAPHNKGEETLCVVMELFGRHAISRWADAVGPPLGGLTYLKEAAQRNGSSTKAKQQRSKASGLREESAEADGKCLRGQLPPQLPVHDLGIYAAQSHDEASQMEVWLPPRLPRGEKRGLNLAEDGGGTTRRFERTSSAETACFIACHGLVQEVLRRGVRSTQFSICVFFSSFHDVIK